MDETFGAYIKRLRGNRTKKEVAKASGFTAEYIRRIEEENKIPSQQILIKLAKGLGTDGKDLIFRALREKAPKEAKKYYSQEAAYPSLRKALLSSYDNKIFTSATQSSVDEIEKEFAKFPLHPIESILLTQTMFYLQKEGKAQDHTSSKGYSYSIPEENKNKRIESSGLRWVYDNRLQLLTYTFTDKKNKLNHLSLKET